MKDLSLSVLSRGCGRFVSSSQNVGRHDGRLDVCFTPQDYHIWKSQDTVLQLSSRGHVHAETESSVPKTYSTRRGPLLLYSQYLVSLKTSCQSQPRDKKKVIMQRYAQQTDQHWGAVRELTSAFSINRNNQLICSRLEQPYFLHHLHPSPVSIYSTQEQNSPRISLHPNSQPSGKNTRFLLNQLEEKEEEKENNKTKKVRMDLFLKIPRTSETPSLKNEYQKHYVAISPAEEAQIYLDASLQHAEVDHHSTVEDPHHPNTVEEDSCIQGSNTTHENNYERLRDAHSNRRTGLLPPLPTGYNREKTVRPNSEGYSGKEPHLPPIAEDRTVISTLDQMQKYSPTREELQIQQNLLQPLRLLENERGRRGLGKQNSLAFLHHRSDAHDLPEINQANRGVVRGILPLELRGLQDDKSVGCLILGPDGEIIQLSLFVSSQDRSNSDTQEQALQVVSAEGEKLPWVVVLQSERSETEDGVEPNIDEPIREPLEQKQKQKHLDLHKQAQMFSTNSHTDAALAGKKEFDKETMMKTRKTQMRNTRSNLQMCPWSEQGEMEGPSGGKDGNVKQAEEEMEGDELGGHSYESHQPRETVKFRNNPKEASTEETVKAKREKQTDVKEASTSQQRKGNKMDRRTESDGQQTHVRKKGRTQKQLWGNDVQSSRQRAEGKSEGGAAEPPDQSTLPPVRETKESRAERLNGVTNEEQKMKGGRRRQKEESAVNRKRRKGKPKDKELISGSQIKEEEVEIKQKMKVRSPPENKMKEDQVKIDPEMEERFHLESTESVSPAQRCNKDPDPEEDKEHQSNSADSNTRSVSSDRPSTAASLLGYRRRSRSTASSCEEVLPASSVGLASSHGRLSSCSTVIVMEEQLMLNPVKPESPVPRRNREQQEALLLAQRAERRRQEVERRRREREEEERKQWERVQTEEKLKNELEEDRRKRAEELRLKRLAEEEEKKKQEEEEQQRARQVQAQRERERRKQEERRRQLEHLQRMREMEEQKRKAEQERVRLEEEKRWEAELKMLQELEESERLEYLQRKKQEEEQRRNKEEDDKRAEEEAALQAAEEAGLQAELLARQTALLQQQLAFRRALLMEAGGLEQTQGISRPWIYSYFTLLQTMGLNARKTEATTL
ncbi:uncharacterized protein KIAA2012 homolog isoform X2 [Takifugu rubripes]|uniref:uncharacterized protein KIAA2012 homolog isoform X2 n=1 Tax=Takifugu rubripes TaxID=31033 RepID=UPI0011458BC1|nr:uncharacterized protein KIAA2012 homolog isoform X2 [Takifugu rubripes]